MMLDTTMQNVKRMTLEATIIRADGSREEQGIIASYDLDSPKEPEVSCE
jgi:hypothetical protein